MCVKAGGKGKYSHDTAAPARVNIIQLAASPIGPFLADSVSDLSILPPKYANPRSNKSEQEVPKLIAPPTSRILMCVQYWRYCNASCNAPWGYMIFCNRFLGYTKHFSPMCPTKRSPCVVPSVPGSARQAFVEENWMEQSVQSNESEAESIHCSQIFEDQQVFKSFLPAGEKSLHSSYVHANFKSRIAR